jgi:hypothetical protein
VREGSEGLPDTARKGCDRAIMVGRTPVRTGDTTRDESVPLVAGGLAVGGSEVDADQDDCHVGGESAPPRHGHEVTASMSSANTGPGMGTSRYCGYFSVSSRTAVSRSCSSSTIRPRPSTRTHHNSDQSSS